ncbi:MAG: SPOR domain-containing protein [Bacteroidales bacterium]|nr:SPOR domain-containing protein [Bacteroidales bacterium]
MNKIINELLNTNARVIIPDFGAFIIKQKNPRQVVFNEFLRYNDGLLIDYISGSEGIEKSAAKARVTKFLEEINQKLDRGDEVIMEGLGTLVKDSAGKLTFSEITAKSDKSQQKVKKTTARKEESAKVTPEARPEPKKEDVVKQDKEDKEEKEEKEEKKPAEEKAEQTEKDKKPAEESKTKEEKPVEITFEKDDIKPAPPKEEQKPKEEKISVTPVKTSEMKEKSVRAEYTAAEGKKPVKKTKRKSNSMQILAWIILIVLVNAAIVAWFLFNDQITGLFKRDRFKQHEMTTDIGAEQETPAIEQEYEPDEAAEAPAGSDLPQKTVQDQEPSVMTPAAQPAMHDRKEYYIVAGCFREESNADQLVLELRKKGFQAEKFGKIGTLHAVSFSSFADKSAALEELKKIRNTEQEGAWIAYY